MAKPAQNSDSGASAAIPENQQNEQITPRLIEEEMKTSYIDYAMSVIVGRALPDVRDGLKPVHRRILHAMNELGMVHSKPFKKSARIVGEVLGKYHPHGDTAVYDALVRMAQDFSLRYPLIEGQGNFGCFTKDTKVRLTNGSSLSFGELVTEHSLGKRNFTFTITADKQIIIAEIKNPRITKHNAELVKVTLDNREEITCTPDHRFMLRDGSYCQAQDLTQGMSLMPGYFRLADKEENRHTAGYELVFQPEKEKWEYCHHLADAWNLKQGIYGCSAGRVRHHIDFNRCNNDPTNIRRMHWGAHLKFHAHHAAQLHQSDEYRAKIAAGRSRYWSNEETRQQYAKRLATRNKDLWQTPEYRERMSKFLSDANKVYIKKHPELRQEFSARASTTLKRLWKEPKYRTLFHEKIVAANKRRVTNNTGMAKFLRICHETLATYRQLNERAYEATREAQFGKGFTTWKKGVKKYFGNDLYAVYNRVCKNHRVVSVERLHETADVYDLTVETTHNFLLAAGVFVHNSVDGDNAAAMRYTECRLSKIAGEMLADIDKETVDFQPNFDGSLEEPKVLPAKLPSLLVNGTSGIAVGMATNIPPHNIKEVIDGIIALIDDPSVSVEQLSHYVKGPDFPTAGIIQGTSGIQLAYRTGRGKVIVKAKAEIETRKDKERIIVTEIPYQVNKAQLIEDIAGLVRDKRIIGISDIRDESDRDGMRIVIELRKDANSSVVMNQLFTYTNLTTTFGMNMVALVDNQPQTLGLKPLMQQYVTHRQIVVRRRTAFELKKAEERAHLLEGLIIALKNIDDIVQKIKRSKDTEIARAMLVADYALTDAQAKAILDMKLQRLSSLEQAKIHEEHGDLLKAIAEYQAILADEQRILSIIRTELLELKEKYGDERKTVITLEEGAEMDVEDLIKEEDMVVTISHAGYIKRLPIATYRQQNRGGTGVKAAATREEDFVEHLFVASTHSFILFFTNKGRVHWLKVHQIPEASRTAMGKAIVNLIQTGKDEKVASFIPVKVFDEGHFLTLATKKGTIKKTSLSEYARPRQGGIIAITIDEGDDLVGAVLTDGNQQLMLSTKNGMAAKFNEQDVRPMGRAAYGVKGIELRESDEVVSMIIAKDDKTALTICENGYGKRSTISEYRLIRRGGVGVINIQATERNGNVVTVMDVEDEDEVMLISQSGIIIRTPVKGIPTIGRNTQGVRLMKMHENDKVVAAAKIAREE